MIQICFLQSVLRENPKTIEMILHIFCYRLDWSVSVDFHYFGLLLVKLDNRPGLIMENLKSFYNWLFIIIWSATCLSPLQQSPFQLIVSALKNYNWLDVDPLGHNLLPDIHIFLSSRETVEQIPASIIISLDLLLDNSNHQVTWNQFAFFDDTVYFFSQIWTCFYFLSQQISSRQMDKFVLFD